jgi:hypothetical protein
MTNHSAGEFGRVGPLRFRAKKKPFVGFFTSAKVLND